MKRIGMLVVAAVAALGAQAADVAAVGRPVNDQLRRLRVLAIGNSYTQSLDPELKKVAQAAGVDLDLPIIEPA